MRELTLDSRTGTATEPCLNVYVVWAAQEAGGRDASEGASLAGKIYDHLCYDGQNPFFGGLGVPVYFRSVPPPSVAFGAPLKIDLDAAERSVVIVLVDPEMVLTELWDAYVSQIAGAVDASIGRHLLLPVSLSEGAFQFSAIPSRNYVRYHRFPAGQRWPLLRLWLTNEICRHFRVPLARTAAATPGALPEERVSPAPVRIFLSHAKADGRDEAVLLRQALQQIPSVPFFDEVDIGPGYDIGNEIVQRIADAAVIIFLTDAYSDRPWCQKEVLAAKRLQRPLVVVDDLQGKVYRSFPYLGNVPTIRKTPGDETEIIGLALDEALRTMVLSRRMAQLQGREPDLAFARFLLRPPEVLDGLHLSGLPAAGVGRSVSDPPEADASAGPQTVLYPDPPLGADEASALHDTLLARYRFATPMHVGGPARLGAWSVGVSISESPDLAALGFAAAHLNEVMTGAALYLLAGGARLAYGGDFREGGFTEVLTGLVATYNATGSVDFRPIENYQAWPYYLRVTRDREATLRRIAHLHRVPERDRVRTEFGTDPDAAPVADSPEARLVGALCLTQMREAMNGDTNARFLVGGRVAGFAGVLPGVIEEAYMTLRDGKALFLVGAFGGCASVVIDLLLGQDSPALEVALAARDPELVARYLARAPDPAPGDYGGIKRFFAERGTDGLHDGLTDGENRRLFEERDTRGAILLLLRGLDNLSS